MSMNCINRYIIVIISILSLAVHTLHAVSAPQDSTSSTDYYIEGVRVYSAGDLEKAEVLMHRAIALDAGNDAAYYYISAIFMQRGDAHEAVRYIDEAIQLAPENDWYKLTLARLYSEMDEDDFAISTYEELISRNPSKSSYYYELIDLYGRTGEYGKALLTLDRIEASKGMSELTGGFRYELLVRDGQYDEAEKVLMEIDRRFPSEQNSLMLGDIHKNRYDDSTALYYYDRALAINPDYSPAYFGKAEIYRIKSDIPRFFENIIKFMSDPMIAPSWKSEYVQQIIFPSGIVPVFRKECDSLMQMLVDVHPKDTTMLSLAAYYFIGVEEADYGMQLLRRNVETNPTSLMAHNDLMARLYALEDWDSLVQASKDALKMFPEQTTMYEILAIAYWQQEDIDQALRIYKEIVRRLPDDHPMLVNCYASLGDLSHAKGDNKAAYRYYKKGLKLDGGYLPILNNYAYFLSVEGKNLSKALEMSRKTIEADPDNPTYLDTYGWILYLMGDYAGAKKYLKEATLYGGKESAVILDHYADALFALGEYNLAFLYWGNADKIDPSLGIAEKVVEKKAQIEK